MERNGSIVSTSLEHRERRGHYSQHGLTLVMELIACGGVYHQMVCLYYQGWADRKGRIDHVVVYPGQVACEEKFPNQIPTKPSSESMCVVPRIPRSNGYNENHVYRQPNQALLGKSIPSLHRPAAPFPTKNSQLTNAGNGTM